MMTNNKEKEIPLAVKKDFQEKHPSVEIISFDNGPADTWEMKFIDNEKNEALIVYIDGVWKMTHTKLKNLNQLPFKTQKHIYRY